MLESTKNLYYLMLSVPLLYAFMLGEAWYARKRVGKKRSLKGMLQNINISMGQQAFGAFFQLGIAAVYTSIYQRFHFFEMEKSLLTLAIAFVLLDFNTYVFHRLSHRTNALWANHSVHHSSEEFGLSAGVRHPWFAALLLSMPQYSLAVLGVPPHVFFPLITGFYLYQFFTHSDLVPKLGWVEKVLVTPSAHRVHHASDAKYLDCNYGAVLILWDRLFGTYVEEQEEPTYGLVEPTRIESPLWENLYPYRTLFRSLRTFPTLREKLAFLMRAPGNPYGDAKEAELRAIQLEAIAIDRHFRGWGPRFGSAVHYAMFAIGWGVTVFFMGAHHVVPPAVSLALAALILLLVCLQPTGLAEAAPVSGPPVRDSSAIGSDPKRVPTSPGSHPQGVRPQWGATQVGSDPHGVRPSWIGGGLA